MQRPHALGNFIRSLTSNANDFVQVLMQVPEIWANNVPMDLFADKLQIQQLDEH